MVLAILRRGFTLGLRRNSGRMEPMRFFTRHYFAVLILTSLAAGNAWAQREAKVEANLKSLANGETKTGSGPESPGAGLQGTRNELYKIQRSDTLELTFPVNSLGTSPARHSCHLPRQRFQNVVPQLQPRFAGRAVRAVRHADRQDPRRRSRHR